MRTLAGRVARRRGIDAGRGASGRAARGGFLFTHRGYSGPAVLDVSHVAVRSRSGREPRRAVGARRLDAAGRARAGAPAGRRARAGDLRRRPRTCPSGSPSARAGGRGARGRPHLRRSCGATNGRRLLRVLTAYPLPWTGDEGYRTGRGDRRRRGARRGAPRPRSRAGACPASTSAARCSTPSARSAATTSAGRGPPDTGGPGRRQAGSSDGGPPGAADRACRASAASRRPGIGQSVGPPARRLNAKRRAGLTWPKILAAPVGVTRTHSGGRAGLIFAFYSHYRPGFEEPA